MSERPAAGAGTDAATATATDAAMAAPSPVDTILITLGAFAPLIDAVRILGSVGEMPRRHWDFDQASPWDRPLTATISLVLPSLLVGFAAIGLQRATRQKAWLALMGVSFLTALIASLHGLPTSLIADASDDPELGMLLGAIGDAFLVVLTAIAAAIGGITARRVIGIPLALMGPILVALGNVGMLLLGLLRDGDAERAMNVPVWIAQMGAVLLSAAWLTIAAGAAPSSAPDRGRLLRAAGGVGVGLLLVCFMLVRGPMLLRDANETLLVPAFLSVIGWILLALGGVGLARGGVAIGWVILSVAALQIFCCPVHVAVAEEAEELNEILAVADTLSVALVFAALAAAMLLSRKLGSPGLAVLAAVLLLLGALFLGVASVIGLIEIGRAWQFVLQNLVVPLGLLGLTATATRFFLLGRAAPKPAPAP